MCQCDPLPPSDPHADAAQQVEAEQQIAEQKSAIGELLDTYTMLQQPDAVRRVPSSRPSAHTQLAAVAVLGMGHVMRVADRRAMEREVGDAPDTRTRDEIARDRAIVQNALAAAASQVCPDAHARHLETLAFATGVLMERQFRQLPPCATHEEQYIALYEAKRAQLGRPLWPMERERLGAASRAIWQATADPMLPQGATWTARTVAA